MRLSFQLDNITYVFERIVRKQNARHKAISVKSDVIKLISVYSEKYNKHIDPLAYKQSISLQRWNDLLTKVLQYSCSYCGEINIKGECINSKFHKKL